jgi:hypothetical protein
MALPETHEHGLDGLQRSGLGGPFRAFQFTQ